MVNPLQRYPIEPIREATLSDKAIDLHFIAIKDALGYWHHLEYKAEERPIALAIVHAINERNF